MTSDRDDYDIVVDGAGDGEFETVGAAVGAVPAFREEETRILVRAGRYDEKLVVPTHKTNVTLVGEGAAETVLTHDDHNGKPDGFGGEFGTSGSASAFLFGDGFTARDLTFENDAGRVGQAVAARVDSDRAVFDGCRFVGNQDTLYTHGRGTRQYYRDCRIEGTVDFVFGWATAFFEGCEVVSKGESGYVTAASTPEGEPFGYVFDDCRFVGEGPDGSVYLGRPWRPHARTVVLNSYLGPHVRPAGWHNWDDPDKEETAFYAEYRNEGPGYAPDERVEWSHQLTDEEAADHTREAVFGGWDPTDRLRTE
ncbi:pectinesterase family protein [Candidatus Halobonum tyrrellensis]|uniref:Pectinesterase n=1 Tax=Candidatus Halobonum tyrrellensis G22 TaxID=1324957 RepID=V4HHD8_9EURY|nr:pectinesterase family protein [Candidatus Halobonum tyrrellensis]ESP90180.1 pectinesterase [Candidatus Halobonum tyrrellensis G22]